MPLLPGAGADEDRPAPPHEEDSDVEFEDADEHAQAIEAEAPPEPLRLGGHAQELLPMILQLFRDRRQTGATNDALVDHLCSSGSVTDTRIEAAFRAVDRAKFIPDADGASAYDDSPIRSGHFHMSQPSLYADALAALELEEGNSFLNVGSGTGYLSSIVSEITGKSMHHGVDVHEDVLDHAKAMLKNQGKEYIQFFHMNVHDVDISRSPRYQRIYLGACAGGESKRILDLLEIGGVLVGPFATSFGQHIRRVVRKSATSFEVKNLKSVQFGSLLQSDSLEKFELPCPMWTPSAHGTYSKAFRAALMTVLLSTMKEESPTHIVPREIFVDHVFGFVHPRWFDDPGGLRRTEVLHDGGEREMGDEGNFDEEMMQLRALRTSRMFARIGAPHRHAREERLTLDQFMMMHILNHPNMEIGEESEDGAAHEPATDAREEEEGLGQPSADPLNDSDSEAPNAIEEPPLRLPEPVAPTGATASASPSGSSGATAGRRAISRGCQAF